MNKKSILKFILAGAVAVLSASLFASCNTNSTEPGKTEESIQVTTEKDSDTYEETTKEDEQSKEETTMNEQVTEETSTNEVTTEEITTVEETTEYQTDVSVTESGNTATVISSSGMKYEATGYSAYENGTFTINQDFDVQLKTPVTVNESFNRVKLFYSSDKPLKLTAVYVVDGKEVEDLLYLEAGQNEFNFLILGYIKNKNATELKSLKISTCEKSDASFMLCGIFGMAAEQTPVNVYYLENEYYKLGVRLAWGGGICYLNDKVNTFRSVSNLINQADEGRLVQQSYYGTGGNEEYTPGEFNGSKWSYNPVQGGDKYRNASRIIDVQAGDGYVYIKAQPQDWSLDGKITPSYMENKYILDGKVIRVDNRFVDFSGWEHRYSSQELPAFYTISWLNTFYCYQGSKSWTNDALTVRDDLNFWGDSQYHADCEFKMPQSNTETWCAWANPEYNYGIGLYVPNVDILLAGRHAFNNSKDSNNSATNYVAPVNIIKMVSFEPIEYSYLMTTGSVEEIRDIFTQNKDFEGNESLHNNYRSNRSPDFPEDPTNLDFSTPGSMCLAATKRTSISYSKDQEAMRLEASGKDVQTTLDFTVCDKKYVAEDYKTITITYMIPEENSLESYGCQLFLCCGDVLSASSSKSVKGDLIKDGEYHTISFSLEGLDFWSGDINKIRFDYFNASEAGDVMYVKSFVLS